MNEPKKIDSRWDWEPLPPGHLPRPNYFPAGTAMGVAFIFWGLIASWVILLAGVAIFVAMLAGWIAEICHGRDRR
jgi:hypothetical protein